MPGLRLGPALAGLFVMILLLTIVLVGLAFT
jgi:hypothetical protein